MTSRPFSFPVSLTPMRNRPAVGGGGRCEEVGVLVFLSGNHPRGSLRLPCGSSSWRILLSLPRVPAPGISGTDAASGSLP